MALHKGTKIRIIMNKARRRRWADSEIRGYEKAMKVWWDKVLLDSVGKPEGNIPAELLATEPVFPEKLRALQIPTKAGGIATRWSEMRHAQ